MIAEAPAKESPPDLRLTIDIVRPSPNNPEGSIRLSAEEKGLPAPAEAVAGAHDEQTMKRALLGVYSKYSNVRTAWANRMRRDERGHGR